jgi:cobalamin biosynthesis protein CbiD
MDPMDVDDWLKSVEKKLQVVQCNNHEKVLLASHQLSGPAARKFGLESPQKTVGTPRKFGLASPRKMVPAQHYLS